MTIVFKTFQGNGSDHLQTKHKIKTYQRTTMESNTKGIILTVPFNKRQTYADHGFAHTAASHWHNLLKYNGLAEDVGTFKKLLITHYFKLAQNS